MSKEGVSDRQLDRFHESRLGGNVGLFFLRIILVLIPNLYTEYITSFYTTGLRRTYYFTQISMNLVTIVAILGVIISFFKIIGVKSPRFVLRIYQVLFETTFVSQIIVFVVYWLAIHHTKDELVKELGPGSLEYLIISHIIPFLCISVDLLIARPVVIQAELKYMVYYGIAYILNNFIQTKIFDWRPYPFMTWENYNSLIAAVVIMAVMMVFYTISSKFTHMINGIKEKED
mmetsp:Transcript_32390/g.28684  ORF Transcript_32390/g.28684 Transcript_32390/m.28684 type:complete len:231 (-) Transcript_32390:29-721(-)